MAQALGINAQLLGKTESVYGTAPTGNYAKLPFVSSNLGSTQQLIEVNILGAGRDAQQPARGNINVDGDVAVPLDVRNIGQWLTWLLGAPTTVDNMDGTYTHTFASGGSSIPSFSLEVGMPDLGQYFMVSGNRVGSMALDFQPEGVAQATVNLIGQSETRAGTSGGGTPTSAAFQRFNNFQGAIRKDGSALANVVGASLSYGNGLTAVRAIRADGLIADAVPTAATLTGNLNVMFDDVALLSLAENGTPCELEFSYTIDAENSLKITAHEVYLPKAKQSISGPAGIQASYDFQAAKDASLGKMATFVLLNDVASYA